VRGQLYQETPEQGKEAILASKHRDEPHPHNLRRLRNLLAKSGVGFRSFQSSRINIPEKESSFCIASQFGIGYVVEIRRIEN